MNARELRIGNLITDRAGKTLRIDWFERDKVCQRNEVNGVEVHPITEDIELCRPIPLTEEWLKRAGYEKVRSLREWIGKYHIIEELSDGLFTDRLTGRVLRNVHTWQNVYFAQTGEELQFAEI